MIKIMKYGEVPNSEIFARSVPKTDVAGTVAEIIKNVRENGDKALFEYLKRRQKTSENSTPVRYATVL